MKLFSVIAVTFILTGFAKAELQPNVLIEKEMYFNASSGALAGVHRFQVRLNGNLVSIDNKKIETLHGRLSQSSLAKIKEASQNVSEPDLKYSDLSSCVGVVPAKVTIRKEVVGQPTTFQSVEIWNQKDCKESFSSNSLAANNLATMVNDLQKALGSIKYLLD